MTADVIRIILRISQCPHLSQVPLCTPSCIRVVKIVLRLSLKQWNLSHRPIVTGISPIHVACQSTSQQHMIQTGIKLHLILAVGGFHPDSAQILLPLCSSLLFRLIESKRSSLRLQIQPGIGDRRKGKTYLNRNSLLLFGLECKIQTGTHSGRLPAAATHNRTFKGTVTRRLCICNSREIHSDRCIRLVFFYIFGQGTHPTLNAAVGRKLHFRILYSPALTLTVPDIKQDTALLSGRKGITLKCNPWGSRKFGFHSVILQQHRIISGSGIFILAVEAGTIPRSIHLQRSRNSHQLSNSRH